MGRAPCCDKANVKKGPWSPEEDARLKSYIEQHGTGGNWIALPQKIGLKRCGKSCRLRWLNYLRPNIKHGGFSEEEDNVICSLYLKIGSRWSVIAAQLPGRTDNDVKNYWNTKLKKKLLGKHHQQQQKRTLTCLSSNPRQTMKTENGNSTFVVSDMTWPQLPAICTPNLSPVETSLIEDPQESITKPLVQFGEGVFYEDGNIDAANIFAAARSSSADSIKSALSQGPNTHCSTAVSGLTFQQRLHDLDMELLDQLLYGNYQQQLLDGSAAPQNFARSVGDRLSYLDGDSFSTDTTGMACATFYSPPSDQLAFSAGAHDGSAHHQFQQMPIRNRAFGDESAYRCFGLQ